MNSVHILGTITRDPELKYTASGTAILSFGIAYNERRKQQDGSYQDHAHFFDVTAFGRRAENINQYFRKGSRILIDGSLDYQQWTANDGSKRSRVGIKLEGFDFIDRKNDGGQAGGPSYPHGGQVGGQAAPQQPAPAAHQQPTPQPAQPPLPEVGIDEDEIPF